MKKIAGNRNYKAAQYIEHGEDGRANVVQGPAQTDMGSVDGHHISSRYTTWDIQKILNRAQYHLERLAKQPDNEDTHSLKKNIDDLNALFQEFSAEAKYIMFHKG